MKYNTDSKLVLDLQGGQNCAQDTVHIDTEPGDSVVTQVVQLATDTDSEDELVSETEPETTAEDRETSERTSEPAYETVC